MAIRGVLEESYSSGERGADGMGGPLWSPAPSWYETTLPLKERKSRGHFSTPPRLVAQILDACGYTPDHDLTRIRVLDPACGSGNFLVEAASRLVSFSTCNGLSQEERAALIQRNIWGLDPDPVSCFLAEMQLNAITCSPLPLHIHQADGLALFWDDEPCVDLFLANPPYLAAKNTDLSGYRSTRQRGQADSYLLFLSLGLQIVRSLGWIGLVLPDPVLARTNAARERTRLLKEFTIHHLWHLSGVFTAQVGAVVIIAQKTPPSGTHQIPWAREKWVKQEIPAPSYSRGGGGAEKGGDPCGRPSGSYLKWIAPCRGQVSTGNQVISQSLFLHQPGAEFRYLLSAEQGPSIERLRAYFDETPPTQRRLAPLSEFLSIRRGEELGIGSSLLVHRNLDTMNGCRVHSRGAPCVRPGMGDEATYPLLRGGRDIRPYATSFQNWWIAREAITKPIERYLLPKLLVVKSTDRLQAALDTQGHVALQTLYLLHLRTKETNEDDLYFFLALLNSRLLREYVYVLHTAYKWVQPQIEQHVLAHLPIPIATPNEKQQIINRAKLLASLEADKSAVGTINRPLRPVGRLPLVPIYHGHAPVGGSRRARFIAATADLSAPAPGFHLSDELVKHHYRPPLSAPACSEPDPVVKWNKSIQSLYEEQERAICALYDAAL